MKLAGVQVLPPNLGSLQLLTRRAFIIFSHGCLQFAVPVVKRDEIFGAVNRRPLIKPAESSSIFMVPSEIGASQQTP